MSLTVAICFARQILVLPALLFTAQGRAEDAAKSPLAAPQSQQPVLPEAPIGHRQPRAADIPSTTGAGDPSDHWLNRLNRDTDRKLWICRDC